MGFNSVSKENGKIEETNPYWTMRTWRGYKNWGFMSLLTIKVRLGEGLREFHMLAYAGFGSQDNDVRE